MTNEHPDTLRRRNLNRQAWSVVLKLATRELCDERFRTIPRPDHASPGPCNLCPILKPCTKASHNTYPAPHPNNSQPHDQDWHIAVQYRNLNRAARRVTAHRSDGNPGRTEP